MKLNVEEWAIPSVEEEAPFMLQDSHLSYSDCIHGLCVFFFLVLRKRDSLCNSRGEGKNRKSKENNE